MNNSNPLAKNGAAYNQIAAGASILDVQNFGLEVVDLEVYDSASFAASTAVVTTQLFQTPIGQSGKSQADTSLVQAGQLEGGQAFRVRGIALTVLPSVAPADLIAFAQNTWLNFTISSGRSYWTSPSIFVPGGSVPVVNAAALYDQGAATIIQSTSNGFPSISNVRPLQYPVTIGDGEHFQWTLNVSTAFDTIANNATPVPGTGIKFWVRMYGDLFRFIR